MRVIDFRARPNTKEYMSLYPGTYAWDTYFNCPKPEPAPLADFIAALNEAGVSQAVFTGRNSPRAALSNDFVAECVQAHPDRLFAFAGIDPTLGPDALREIERTITELNMKGISLDPHHIKSLPQ